MLLFLNVDHYFIFYFTAVDNFIFFFNVASQAAWVVL